MSKPFPKCVSKGCPVEHKCLRKQDGEESQLVDYDKVDSGMGKCEWFIPMPDKVEVIENVEENSGETESMDESTEVESETEI